MFDIKKEIKKNIIRDLLVIALIALFFIQLEKFNNWLFVYGPDLLKTFFDSFGMFSPLFFILTFVFAHIFLVPSNVFIFISGVVYGTYGGLLVSLISEFFTATICFFIGRKLKPFFVRKIKNKKVISLKKYIDKNSFKIILLLRFLGFPFAMVSYLSGMVKIKYRRFILATFIGYLPYIFIYSYAGSSLINIKSSAFIYYILYFKLGVFVSVLIFYFISKKFS